jgi:ubiquinol-cytochrome c reductase cytochrome b subunit
MVVYFLVFAVLVFFMPNALGHPDNYIPANPMSTPAHIVPEWYFWPFYAILRAFTQDFFFIPAKLMGVLAMFGAILVWFFLPWLDKSPVRSGGYRPLYRKFFFFGLIPAMLVLFYCGGAAAAEPYVMISQLAALYYFAHFLIIIPVVSAIEKPLPLPFSITESVLGKDDEAVLDVSAAPASAV